MLSPAAHLPPPVSTGPTAQRLAAIKAKLADQRAKSAARSSGLGHSKCPPPTHCSTSIRKVILSEDAKNRHLMHCHWHSVWHKLPGEERLLYQTIELKSVGRSYRCCLPHTSWTVEQTHLWACQKFMGGCGSAGPPSNRSVAIDSANGLPLERDSHAGSAASLASLTPAVEQRAPPPPQVGMTAKQKQSEA